jgi:uncharacterized protein
VKRSAIAVLIVLLLASIAIAQSTPADAPASKEDVVRYLDAVHARDMTRQMMDAMAKPMHQLIHEQFLKDKDRLPADFEAQMNKSIDDMMKQMPFDDMIDAMIPAYQKHFTKADMDALVAFYTGPAGQKILKEMPAVTADAMQDMMPIMRKTMDKMTAQVQDQIAQMMKNSAPGSKSTAPQEKN